MVNTARRIGDSAAFQETGTVTAVEDGVFVVETGSATRRARRAVGCLVCPEEGDLVLVAAAREGAWVLTVLERDAGAATRVVVEGDLEFRLPTGSFSIASQEGVNVASGAPVSVVAPSLEVHAPRGRVSIQDLEFLGGFVGIEAEKVRVTAGAVEQVVDRLTQRARRVYRFVEEFEQLRAGRIDYVAKKLLELHGGNAAVTAEGLVKVDGEQIHVG